MSSVTQARETRRRGQPVVVLVALLAIWIGGRSLLWNSPFPQDMPMIEVPALFTEASSVAAEMDTRPDRTAKIFPIAPEHLRFGAPAIASVAPRATPFAPLSMRPAAAPVMLASHQILLMSALSNVPVPSEVAAMFQTVPQPRDSVTGQRERRITKGKSRWSLDGWLFARPGSIGGAAPGPRPATYGASQAGAVLRYKFAPNSRFKPSAYIRATAALAGSEQRDLAMGLTARPVSSIPVSAHAEVRMSENDGSLEARPAAFAVTELAPAKLPLEARITAYGQAGYAGGDFATGFVDGQAKIDREVAEFDIAAVRAGAGMWGGAQKGAARLDVGPTASVDLKIGKVPARVSMDYRHRVAGDAEPQSGLAITLSTGF